MNKEELHPDLFGGSTPIGRIIKGAIQKRKAQIGYREKWKPGRNCKLCQNRIHVRYHGKTYNKCALIGISFSETTDIKLYATCRLFLKGKPHEKDY